MSNSFLVLKWVTERFTIKMHNRVQINVYGLVAFCLHTALLQSCTINRKVYLTEELQSKIFSNTVCIEDWLYTPAWHSTLTPYTLPFFYFISTDPPPAPFFLQDIRSTTLPLYLQHSYLSYVLVGTTDKIAGRHVQSFAVTANAVRYLTLATLITYLQSLLHYLPEPLSTVVTFNSTWAVATVKLHGELWQLKLHGQL